MLILGMLSFPLDEAKRAQLLVKKIYYLRAWRSVLNKLVGRVKWNERTPAVLEHEINIFLKGIDDV